MCGIVGIAGGRIDRSALIAMRDTLAHRGPDDAGVQVWPDDEVGLAHRRLAVISPVAAGRQPMSNADGTSWITFNGEIYNYRELRAELVARGHRLRTETDTEVLLEAYEEWGTEVLSHLDGMFAFAIWDRLRQQLLLARDRLGIKPLYYRADPGRLIFASEPRAILAHPSVSARIDEHSLLDYLSYGYVPGEACIFDGIRKLPAAHLMIVSRQQTSRQGVHRRAWWSLEPGDWLGDRAEAVGRVRAEIQQAVERQLVSDVPIGVFLSGGIDSSAVTASAAMARAGVQTFSVGFDRGLSELPFAARVAAHHQTDHHQAQVSIAEAGGIERTLAGVFDEPLADTSAIPTYLLCKAGRQKVTVALSGDGGDELFAGYTWYARQLSRARPPAPLGALLARAIRSIRQLPRGARAAALLRHIEKDVVQRHFLYVHLFDRWEISRLAGPALRGAARDHDATSLFEQHLRRDLPLLTALQYLDLNTFLVDDILVKVDRASMASSLEVRPPLLDHRVVELAFRAPPEWHVARGRGKALLADAVADRVPSSILDREKRGFGAPVTAWFRSGLWSRARARLAGGRLVSAGILDRAFVDWMVASYTERRWAKVWALLLLEEWYRRWIEGEAGE